MRALPEACLPVVDSHSGASCLRTGCAPWGLVAGPAPMRGTTAGGALPAGVAFMGVRGHACNAAPAAGRASARRGCSPPRSHWLALCFSTLPQDASIIESDAF